MAVSFRWHQACVLLVTHVHQFMPFQAAKVELNSALQAGCSDLQKTDIKTLV
jgi:hypothetical protein